MRRALALTTLAAAVTLACEASIAAGGPGNPRTALVPLKRSVRAAAVATEVENSLQARLQELGSVVGSDEARDVLRRLRLRDLDSAPPETLEQLARELDVDWLVAATLHDVVTEPVPDLSLSIRFYDSSGELVWNEFKGRSGLDGETVLGFGVLDSVEEIAPLLVERLLATSPIGGGEGRASERPERADLTALGKIALLPLTGYVEQDALAVADAATEAARATLKRAGVALAAPACIHNSMRRQQAQKWGELSLVARKAVLADCGVDRILTGAVEHWKTGGTGLEPRPEIALSLRLLDATSGRILWMASREGTGWDKAGLFGRGRIYSRGEFLKSLLSDLTRELTQLDPDELANRTERGPAQ